MKDIKRCLSSTILCCKTVEVNGVQQVIIYRDISSGWHYKGICKLKQTKKLTRRSRKKKLALTTRVSTIVLWRPVVNMFGLINTKKQTRPVINMFWLLNTIKQVGCQRSIWTVKHKQIRSVVNIFGLLNTNNKQRRLVVNILDH